MTSPFVLAEQAQESPVELYRFSLGGYFWRYTNADQAITSEDGEVFVPEAVTRTPISISEEANSSAITITLPADNQVARYFTRTGAPAKDIWVTVLRQHRESGKLAQLFTGTVGSGEFVERECQLNCLPLRSAVGRSIPLRLIQSLCSNALYDERCQVNKASFSNAATVTAIDGLVLTVSGISGRATGYFSGGYIHLEESGLHATVSDHTNPDQLRLLFDPGVLVGDEIVVYAGCDKRMTTCINKFANQSRFQGFPYIPTVDPFKDGLT